MKSIPLRARSAAALATGVAAALALSSLAAAPAFATPALASPAAAPAAVAGSSVTNAVFDWGFNNESNNKSFSGDFNFFSAGKIAKTNASDKLEQSEWKATDGNVTIQKQQADGSYATSTWAGLSTTPAGAPILSPTAKTYSGNRVAIANGTGTFDATAENADIAWDGDFTVAYYGGLTQFFVSDPHLVVTGGEGSITATLSGYQSDMANPDLYVPIPDTTVTLADLGAVDVTPTGFVSTPDYLGVQVTLPASGTPQSRTGDTWGAFPQSFVDFQQLTGQTSYWYSSGSSLDGGKVATPVTVGYSVAQTPTVTVSKVDDLNPAGETITVSGSGFLPNPPATSGTRPPLAGQFTGTYIAFGTFLDAWKASEGAPSSARKNDGVNTKWAMRAPQLAAVDPTGAAGGVLLNDDGTFSVTMTVKKGFSGALADGNYGVYTYPAGGAVYAPFETYTPVTFAPATVDRLAGADRIEGAVKVSQEAYPEGTGTAYVVSGYNFADALSAAPAAVKESAPLLLTAQDALPAAVTTELERLKPSKIVVVGGPNSVSEAVYSALKSLTSDQIVRIQGTDRYATSLEVVRSAFGGATVANAYVATGANFPDALSASAAAGTKGEPVVLVPGTDAAVSQATKDALAGLGATTITIAGGPASVSEGVKASLATVTGVTSVQRLDGADRFSASVAINNAAFAKAGTVFLATGYNYPDALAGAALAGLRGAPLYVVPTDCVPEGVRSAIRSLGADTVTLLGGPNSLSAAVQSLTVCS